MPLAVLVPTVVLGVAGAAVAVALLHRANPPRLEGYGGIPRVLPPHLEGVRVLDGVLSADGRAALAWLADGSTALVRLLGDRWTALRWRGPFPGRLRVAGQALVLAPRDFGWSPVRLRVPDPRALAARLEAR